MHKQRQWVNQAIAKIKADYQRSADTHLIKLSVPKLAGIDLYLKDESTHPTGSLKHRLARSLFLYALCNGKIQEDTVIIEASSGSTAISEAYFARLLGLRFIAVMAKNTSQNKIQQIQAYGGECHLVENTALIYQESEQLATKLGGYYMDQFTNAERATDWRGNNNIADSIFQQMQLEKYPIPSHIVMSAGTGGTSATIGRYIRYHQLQTMLTVVDPEHSVFYDYFNTSDGSLVSEQASLIEGIGRPRVEPSFIKDVVDDMQRVTNKHSIAAMLCLEKLIGKKVGASTGTNFVGVMELATKMLEQGEQGSIVTLLCDRGERYSETYYNSDWVNQHIGDINHEVSYFEGLLG